MEAPPCQLGFFRDSRGESSLARIGDAQGECSVGAPQCGPSRTPWAATGGPLRSGPQRLYPHWGPPTRGSQNSASPPGSKVAFRNAGLAPAELAQQGLVNIAIWFNGESPGNPGRSANRSCT